MSILVIDIGSSSIRVMLFDKQAQPIPGTQITRRHQFNSNSDGSSEVSVQALCSNVEACIDDILRHPLARDIEAMGMATFVGNLMGLDIQGQPITPLYTYADTRCAEDVSRLQHTHVLSAVHYRTGCRIHSAYHPARLSWLKRTQPELYNTVHTWTDIASYLYLRWFGEHRCSYSVASWSGLFNRHELTWDTQWVQDLGLSENQLPILSDYNLPQTKLLADYAKRWPALQHIPAYLALGDGAAANAGSGALKPDTLALTIGTTAALRYVTKDPDWPVPESLWAYRISREMHLIGGATSEGGNVFAWIKNTLALPDDAEAQIIARDADVHGLSFLPLLAGERAPGWATQASGTLHGLGLHHSPTDILQASLEGIALRLVHIAEQLSVSDGPVLAGGGAISASDIWGQILADALNRPIHCLSDPEPTARGVALLVLAALNNERLNDTPAISRIFLPRSAHVQALQAARQRQDWLYQQLYS